MNAIVLCFQLIAACGRSSTSQLSMSETAHPLEETSSSRGSKGDWNESILSPREAVAGMPRHLGGEVSVSPFMQKLPGRGLLIGSQTAPVGGDCKTGDGGIGRFRKLRDRLDDSACQVQHFQPGTGGRCGGREIDSANGNAPATPIPHLVAAGHQHLRAASGGHAPDAGRFAASYVQQKMAVAGLKTFEPSLARHLRSRAAP